LGATSVNNIPGTEKKHNQYRTIFLLVLVQ
jgi:hypothetical protein